jgi:hypothetical protein
VVRVETKGFFGQVKRAPACGAVDAEAAAKRIEAARLPSPPPAPAPPAQPTPGP